MSARSCAPDTGGPLALIRETQDGGFRLSEFRCRGMVAVCDNPTVVWIWPDVLRWARSGVGIVVTRLDGTAEIV